MKHIGVFDSETLKLFVGFTATPKRTDGARLGEVFEDIVFSRDLPTMIAKGHLSPVAAYRVETDVDLSPVRTNMGDFVTSQLSGVVNTRDRNDLVMRVYESHLRGKKAVCFCVDVSLAPAPRRHLRHPGVLLHPALRARLLDAGVLCLRDDRRPAGRHRACQHLVRPIRNRSIPPRKETVRVDVQSAPVSRYLHFQRHRRLILPIPTGLQVAM